ncbi:hydroxypyruvate isomerase family protein [Labrys neptuniae]
MNLFSVHLGYVLGTLPFPERFARARALGFRAVEIPFPYDMPAEDYAALLDRYGLRQISIGAPTSDYRRGETGPAVDPRQRAGFRHSLEQAARYAGRIGCPAVHVFSGCTSPDLSPDIMDETYCENLALAAEFLAGEGITTLIEPINATDFPNYHLDSLEKALAVMAMVGSANIRLIFDVYHLAMMGLDPAQALRDNHHLIRHVQFADFPARHEPGSGSLDFEAIVGAMRAVGYGGSAGLEYIPLLPPGAPLELPAALADYAGLGRMGPSP